MERLVKIQSELKAPKNLKNNFGNYKYRNLESILEALKPLLARENLALIISDSIENIGGANYIKAEARIVDSEKVLVANTAYAREPLDSKGMSPSQMTGSASSYARKYALGGLFLIDDSLDVDSDDFQKNTQSQPAQPPKPPKTIRDVKNPAQVLIQALMQRGLDKEKITAYMQAQGFKSGNTAKMVELLNHLDDLVEHINGFEN